MPIRRPPETPGRIRSLPGPEARRKGTAFADISSRVKIIAPRLPVRQRDHSKAQRNSAIMDSSPHAPAPTRFQRAEDKLRRFWMDYQLKGKLGFVTAGAQGIGRAIA